MSCFGCCEDDDHNRAADNGGGYPVKSSTGSVGGYHASQMQSKGAQSVKIQPIEVPAIHLDELRDVTDNFGTNSLIGEGSYGRVYYGMHKSGQAAAIKKLDASKQPDDEFLSQAEGRKFCSTAWILCRWRVLCACL